jgi:flagellar assembly factor FliW
MPVLATEHFGVVEYTSDHVWEFPAGLPGFDDETQLLAIERPETAPVVFLQSLRRPGLALVTLPVALIDPDYELAATPEDVAALELPPQPERGRDFQCLAVITLAAAEPPTANLMAPIVVNLRTRRAWQVISMQENHSMRHPLTLPGQDGGSC